MRLAWEKIGDKEILTRRAQLVIETGKSVVMPMLRAMPGSTELEIVVQPNSALTFSCLNVYALHVKFTIHEAARVECFSAMSAVQSASLRLETHLVGVGAALSQRTIFLGSYAQVYNMRSSTIMHAKNCEAFVEAKGVLSDQASACFEGGIDILQTAGGSTARLVEHTLLLSPEAKINAIPALHIGTNDVVASHCASITRIDDEQLFYASARGIAPEQAEFMIVDGFIACAAAKTPFEKIMRDTTKEKFLKFASNC